jgi:hypothetical protein
MTDVLVNLAEVICFAVISGVIVLAALITWSEYRYHYPKGGGGSQWHGGS